MPEHFVKDRKRSARMVSPEKAAATTAFLKDQNQQRKAESMVDELLVLLERQEAREMRNSETGGGPVNHYTSSANLTILAENLSVFVEKFGQDLADFTGRNDPPSPKTQEYMTNVLLVKAQLAKYDEASPGSNDDDLFDFS